MSTKLTIVRKLVISFILVLISGATYAYKVSPLVFELTPTGGGARTSMLIENTHEYPLTVELRAVRNTVDLDGHITESDADDDFLIFPPQAIIQTGQSQRVQIQYIGGPALASVPYRIIVAQVPVNIEGAGPALNFNYIFRAAAYVVPPGASFDIEVRSITKTATHYDVELENTGNRHAVLVTGSMTGRSSSGQEQTIDAGTLESIKEVALVPANGTRRVLIPIEAFSELADIETLDIRPER